MIELVLRNNNDKIIGRESVSARYCQAEKLLPLIDKLIKQNNCEGDNLANIEVFNQGGSFTALRIGIITANALGYALGLPVKGVVKANDKLKEAKIKDKFNIIKPIYSKEPNITVKKNK